MINQGFVNLTNGYLEFLGVGANYQFLAPGGVAGPGILVVSFGLLTGDLTTSAVVEFWGADTLGLLNSLTATDEILLGGGAALAVSGPASLTGSVSLLLLNGNASFWGTTTIRNAYLYTGGLFALGAVTVTGAAYVDDPTGFISVVPPGSFTGTVVYV